MAAGVNQPGLVATICAGPDSADQNHRIRMRRIGSAMKITDTAR
jgi:hypothetical protein